MPEWGPIAGFAARLADTVPAWPNGWRRPLAATRAFGGPWGFLARDDWGAEFPPIRPPGPPLRLALADALWQWRNRTERQPFAADYADALADLHRFLEVRNVRFLAESLSPALQSVPASLVRVSPTGLAWALWVYELAVYGSPPLIATPLGTADWPAPPTAGDLLSLHLWIEEVVAASADPEMPATSRPLGGLRTATFLRRFPALLNSKLKPVRRRAAVLLQLVAASPLTQLAYLDLVPWTGDVNRWKPLLNDGDPAVHDAWLALVARSVVAALLGPPPSWEVVCEAEDELEKLKPGGSRVAADFMKGRAEQLRREAIGEGQRRPNRLSAIFTETGAGGRLLHFRAMDMLVRQLASASAPLLLRDRAADADNPTLSVVVTENGNRVMRRFLEAIFAGASVPRLSKLSNAQRESVEAVMTPPLMSDTVLAATATATGVTFDEAKRLQLRFARTGVTLPHPVSTGNPASPSPAALLTAWLTHMKPPPPKPDPSPPPPTAVPVALPVPPSDEEPVLAEVVGDVEPPKPKPRARRVGNLRPKPPTKEKE